VINIIAVIFVTMATAVTLFACSVLEPFTFHIIQMLSACLSRLYLYAHNSFSSLSLSNYFYDFFSYSYAIRSCTLSFTECGNCECKIRQNHIKYNFISCKFVVDDDNCPLFDDNYYATCTWLIRSDACMIFSNDNSNYNHVTSE
jgi:hypothetical protein